MLTLKPLNCARMSYNCIRTPILTSFVRNYADISQLKQQADTTKSDQSASTTGVIDKTKQEILLYYDNVYPWSKRGPISRYFFWLFPVNISPTNLKDKVTSLSSPLPAEVEITDVVPIRRDDGVFIKYKLPPDIATSNFITTVKKNVEVDHGVSKLASWWNPGVRVFDVKGTPWIEDLKRFPSAKLAVTGSLTEEELYVLFRRYGVINDIIVTANEPTKVLFRSVRSAIIAKNCINGLTFNGTTVHLTYIPIKRVNYLTDFVVNHTRIAMPIILALLATAAVLIFDPIRQWFIEYKINHSNDKARWYKVLYVTYSSVRDWITSNYDYYTTSTKSEDDLDVEPKTKSEAPMDNSFWFERIEKSKQVRLWIKENTNTFIIVKGPPGSGKEEFILEHTLHKDDKLNQRVLLIECDQLAKARSDSTLFQKSASQLGYFPVFTWTNNLSQFIDLGIQGLTGQKSGLSESKEARVKGMFSLSISAIRNITDQEYTKYVKSIERINRNKPEGSKLDILNQEDFLQQHPESKPIIVVTKFARKADTASNDFVFPMIADWGSQLVQNNLAHVIFSTADVGSLQHLAEALPNQVFKDISLSDASMTSSKQYVCDQLKLDQNRTTSIDNCIEPIGGRMLDLQAFVRRVKSGETPNVAIIEMINQASELITSFFLESHKIEQGDHTWTSAQVWLLMKMLSNSDVIEYNDLIKSPLFSSTTSADTIDTLSTLEKYDLLALKRDKGVLKEITTGRPLFKAAFQNIIKDLYIWKLYETNYLKSLTKLEQDKIQKLQTELVQISSIPGGKLNNRIDYLVNKIETSNGKIIDYEKQVNELAQTVSKTKSSSFLGIF
ncbi:Mitochondrial escape protein 2-2 [Spathaspora sp. JA1]|nr:Mitochondrial escape protein 2-2 [Spathaspora sp. JA1]